MDSPISIPSARVIMPHALREKIGSRASLTVSGHSVREIIDALDHDFPGMRFHLCYETGELRTYVNVFLNRQDVRYLQGLDTPVGNGATIHILQSVAGG